MKLILFFLVLACAVCVPVQAKLAFICTEDSVESVLLRQILEHDTVLLVEETERHFIPSKNSPLPKFIRVFRVVDTLRGKIEQNSVLHYSDHYSERLFPGNERERVYVEKRGRKALFYVFLNSEKLHRSTENCYFYDICGEGPIWGNPIPCADGIWSDAVGRILKIFVIGIFEK